jgi:hypothetical protein
VPNSTPADSQFGAPPRLSLGFTGPSRHSNEDVLAVLAAQADDFDDDLAYYDKEQHSAKTLKRQRETSEGAHGMDIRDLLSSKGAVASVMYRCRVADPQANDVWPNFRNSAKLPARYYLFGKHTQTSGATKNRLRPVKIPKTDAEAVKLIQGSSDELSCDHIGRPEWRLPVELIEVIASHLNRDDLKSMRLVSQELNHYVSQAMFKTVVVPFNTEIYGMLGPEPKLDAKGRKTVQAGSTAFAWNNANGDEVYNGHGLDVFRGFGRHILRYGMSFEVSEDALADPPKKCLTESHVSFWGSYDWPFENYCRFNDVAGLETAADETPRMKIAFSELSKVNELALSVDSGLGWLNGPDRSIRARVLHRPPAIFGTLKEIPDRRAQAQKDLWKYIENCHQEAVSDVKLAILHRLEATQPPPEMLEASLAIEDQSNVPFLDPQLVHQAFGSDMGKPPIPSSFEDPQVPALSVPKPAASATGILYTSMFKAADVDQLPGLIIPTNLTQAQKEWLLETEWAQRAFLLSYMLSIIDNPKTFYSVHTLNISRLSDQYVSALNRTDFWDSLPNLENVTLMVIPNWRSVHKDEAGTVDTQNVNPAGGVDTFYTLLKRVISPRQNITSLCIGWATGGEHAEGIHARNNLLLPAPLVSMEHCTNQNPQTLCSVLLQLPFVEHLTLRNCWITPAVTAQFIRLHDSLDLKHVVFDSVSLTAVLRPRRNNQVAANGQLQAAVAGANAALGGMVPGPPAPQPGPPPQPVNAPVQQPVVVNPVQTLHVRIRALHQLIQQMLLQAQLHSHVQLQNHNFAHQQAVVNPSQQQTQMLHYAVLMQMNVLAQVFAQANHIQQQQAAMAPAVFAHPVQPSVRPWNALRVRPREGSWMNLIDRLTPGANLSDFGSLYSEADAERSTALQSIQFNSCGYARLPHTHYDQLALGINSGFVARTRNPGFNRRFDALAPAMLSTKWPLLGEIVQEINAVELAALKAGWYMETGWTDREAARAVEFDGFAPGGSGRFSGIVRAEDRVMDEASTG